MSILKRILPFLSWFPLKGERVKDDILSGLTVALLLIPQSMAYADLAGMPAYYGLYAAFIPVILAALFGSMAQLSSGPTALTAILSAAVLSSFAPPGSTEYIEYAVLLAFIVGVLRVLMGSFRLAFLFNLVSYPVILGFTNAAAVVIGLSQLGKVFRISPTPIFTIAGDLREFIYMVLHLGETHIPTILVSLVSLAAILILRKWAPKLPSVLLVVVFMTLLSFIFQFESRFGGKVLGTVPAGLPSFGFPWGESGNVPEIAQRLWKLLPGAFVVCIIGFVEISSVTRAISNKTRQKVNLNQELIAQGISAIAGSFFQSFPTSGSFSRSAINYQSGGKTTMSSLFTSLAALVIMLFLTPMLYHLPLAVLAVSIIVSVLRLMDWAAVIRLFRVKKWDGSIAILTFISTIFFAPHIINGVLTGVFLSLAGHLFRTMKPELSELGMYEDGSLRSVKRYNLSSSSHVLPIRISGSIYFASIDNIEKGIERLLSNRSDISYLLLDGSSVDIIDSSGEGGLARIFKNIQNKGLTLILGGFSRSPRDVLVKTGLLKLIGDEHDFSTVDSALKWIKNDMKQKEIDFSNDPLFQE